MGLTIIELMIVLAIVALVTPLIASGVRSFTERRDTLVAIQDIRNIDIAIQVFYASRRSYPNSLAEVGMDGFRDPWGDAYQYFNIATGQGNGTARKDRNLIPLNSDYDLYSKGPDGESVSPLTAKPSHDDIVRANNGQYVGIATDY